MKVDSRKQRLAQEARQILEGFDVDVMQAEIPLLAAFEKAEVEGVCVSNAIDCLLYTSPSPRDATLSRMPSSA